MSTITSINLFLKEHNITISAKEFVEVASNIYHKFESERYDESHFSIELSIPYWNVVLNKLCNDNKDSKLRVLDFGCGTGFVTEQILKSNFNSNCKEITCYDLSPDMINVCKDKFQKYPNINYLSDSAGFSRLKEEKGKFDVIFCNSLIHHILDHEELFQVFNDSIVEGGNLIVGHEPNKNFYQNSVLMRVSNFFRIVKKVTSRIKKIIIKEKKVIKEDLCLLTYKELLKRDIISENFPKHFIQKFIDIHVPMSTLKTQPWGEMGFNDSFFMEKTKNNFKVKQKISYNHIKDQQAYKSLFWKSVSKVLDKLYPNDGADVIFVLHKN